MTAAEEPAAVAAAAVAVAVEQPAEPVVEKKKRGADRQITKDDREDGGEGESEEAPSGEFKKADDATLAKRRIVKVKRPTKEDDPETKKSNPFATVGFGSTAGFSGGFGGGLTGGFKFGGGAGFSSFGSETKTAGFGATTTTTDTTTTAPATGFGATASSKSIFGGGDKKDGEPRLFGFATSTATSTTSETKGEPVLPEDVEVTNGEEGEELVFEMRSKSFQLVAEEEADKKKLEEITKPATMSVPPSSATAPTAAVTDDDNKEGEDKKEDEQKKDKNGDEEDEQPAEVAKEGESNKDETGEDKPKKTQRWSELGKGPLRVLKKGNKARVVQRRENAAGGQGTKLLLNTVLNKDSKLTAPSDKHVQLVTVGNNGTAISYLFKVRNPTDAKQLEGALQQVIDDAKDVNE